MPRKPVLVSTTLTACTLSLLLSSTCLAARINVQVPAVHIKIPSVVVTPTVVVKPTINRTVVFRNNANHILLEGNKSGSSSSPGVTVYGSKAGNVSASPGVAVYSAKAGNASSSPGVVVLSGKAGNSAVGPTAEAPFRGSPNVAILQSGTHAGLLPYWLIGAANGFGKYPSSSECGICTDQHKVGEGILTLAGASLGLVSVVAGGVAATGGAAAGTAGGGASAAAVAVVSGGLSAVVFAGLAIDTIRDGYNSPSPTDPSGANNTGGTLPDGGVGGSGGSGSSGALTDGGSLTAEQAAAISGSAPPTIEIGQTSTSSPSTDGLGGGGGGSGAPKDGGSLTAEQAAAISGSAPPTIEIGQTSTSSPSTDGLGSGGGGGGSSASGGKVQTVEQAQQESGGGSAATDAANSAATDTPAAKDSGSGE
jgi:hypothetical protein